MTWAPADAMLAQIEQQIEFTRPAAESIFLQLLRSGDVRALRRVRKVYLTGCGDSWFVGIAGRLAFEKHAAIEAEALHAMEFSRYAVATASPNSLLIAVSHSGEVARTIEAALLAREKGLYTIAVTGNPESTLAQTCHSALLYEIPNPVEQPTLPGTISFLGCLLATCLTAIYLGEVNGNAPHARADELYYELKKIGEEIGRAITTHAGQIEEWSQHVNASHPAQFIGSGPNYATALYGQMKLLEAAAMPSLVFETEEWAHAGFFLTHADTPLCVVCAEGAGKDRAQEILQPAQELGAHVMLLTSVPSLSARAGLTLHLGENLPEEFSPLLFAVPMQLLAHAVMLRMKTTPFGFDDPSRKKTNSHQIRECKILRSLKDLPSEQN
jgi:glucosamine--fructose-6-phosphate aminotransferase (isomerizing)